MPGTLPQGPSASPCPSSAQGLEESLMVVLVSLPGSWWDDRHLGNVLFGALKDGYGHRFSCYSRFLTIHVLLLLVEDPLPQGALDQAKHLFFDSC